MMAGTLLQALLGLMQMHCMLSEHPGADPAGTARADAAAPTSVLMAGWIVRRDHALLSISARWTYGGGHSSHRCSSTRSPAGGRGSATSSRARSGPGPWAEPMPGGASRGLPLRRAGLAACSPLSSSSLAAAPPRAPEPATAPARARRRRGRGGGWCSRPRREVQGRSRVDSRRG
jgi:hypothetical protein